jgi:hypothetical protein
MDPSSAVTARLIAGAPLESSRVLWCSCSSAAALAARAAMSSFTSF